MSKILITGGAGYIGSHVVWELYRCGFVLVVLDDLSTGVQEGLPDDIIFVAADVSDEKNIDALLKQYQIQTIIHLAAKVSVTESVHEPALYYHENTIKTFQLLQVAKKNNIKNFIFSSTAAVYAEKPDGVIHEQWQLAPQNPYGSSKLAAEYLLQDICKQSDINCIIFRYFNVAGFAEEFPIQYRNYAHSLIKNIVSNLLQENYYTEIYGDDYPTEDGSCIRDFVHVADIAHAHLAVIDYLQDTPLSGIFNIGYGQGYSVKQVLSIAEQIVGRKLQQVIKPRRESDIIRSVADNRKLVQQIGWQPKFMDLTLMIRSELERGRIQLKNF